MKTARQIKKKLLFACSAFLLVPSVSFADEAEVVEKQEESRSLYRNELSTSAEEARSENRSQIRIGKGLIYPIVDVLEVVPQLEIELLEIPVLEGTIKEKVEALKFRITTNYSGYIDRYEIRLFRGDDAQMKAPLRVFSGKNLKNEDTVTVDNLEELKNTSSQFRYQLRVYDAEGRYDETTTGYIEFRKYERTKNLSVIEQEVKERSRAILQKRNIPVKYGKVTVVGQNLRDVKAVEINGDRYTLEENRIDFTAERLLPTGQQSLSVTTFFADETTRTDELIVAIPEKYYSGVGVADFTIGKFSGSKDELVDSDENNSGLYKRGRLAYYGQARFNEDLRMTLQVDTDEKEWDSLFDGFFRKKKDDVYQRLRRDDYYPTYGDDSIILRENDLLQQGKMYAELEYKDSRILWGTYLTNFSDTELSQVNRSLYGAYAEIKSEDATSFGESQYQVKAYGAQAEVGHGRNEFLGTGGSLYFLKHGDVVKGSENITVETRNRDTGLVEKRVQLYRGKDYKIDEYQGRLILTRSLGQYGGSDGSIIKDDLVDKLEHYLVVDYDYEYSSSERMKNLTYGGRAQGWLGDRFSIGATHVNENRDSGGDFELNGVDVAYRYSDSTYVKAEYSKTRSTQTQNNFWSDDGGIHFNQLNESLGKRSGDAYLITGNVNLYDLSPQSFSSYGNEMAFWYKNRDAGFSSGGYDQTEDEKSYGAQLRLRPSENLSLLARYNQLRTTNELTGVRNEKREILSQVEYIINPRVTLTAALSDIHEKRDDENREATLFAGKIDYTKDDFSIYGIAQTALRKKNYDYDQIYTLGVAKELWDQKIKLTGEYSLTNQQDDSFRARIDVRPKDTYSFYSEYEISNIGAWKTNKIVFGNRFQPNNRWGVYSENQVLNERNSKANLNSYGIDYNVKDTHQLGLSYQEGKVRSRGEEYDRKAISISSNYTQPHFRLANKLEYRVDDRAENDLEQFVTTNFVSYKASDSLRFIGSFDYLLTRYRSSHEIAEESTEFEVGFAYRPVNHNRFNWLGRYTYIKNIDRLGRELDHDSETKHVLSTEANYKVNQKWTIGGKLGYKKESYGYELNNRTIEVSNDILFYGIRAEYSVMKEWDLMVEYRNLEDLSSHDTRRGALVGLYRSFGNHLKVGVGYNFSGINDDLRDRHVTNKGWFVNFIGKI